MCVPRGVEGDGCHPFSHKVGDVMSRSLCYTHARTRMHVQFLSGPHLFPELLEVQMISSAGRLAKL